MKLNHWILYFFILSINVNAQRKYEEDAREIGIHSLDRFKSFLALANDASKGNEIQDNIRWAEEQLYMHDFELNLLETSSLPLMIANLTVNDKLPTIAFYMHLDGCLLYTSDAADE